MTVKQLIEILNSIKDKNDPICISNDEEGNEYKEIHEVCIMTQQKQKKYIIYPFG